MSLSTELDGFYILKIYVDDVDVRTGAAADFGNDRNIHINSFLS